MVVRPSLKRVVPGSVPPWRALCAESARALKAFFSVLCFPQVSKSVALLESKFGQGDHLLANPGRGSIGARQEDSLLESQTQLGSLQYPHNSMKGASEHFHFPLGPCGAALIQAAGQCFSWPRRGFPLPAIKKARRPFVWSAL